MNITVQRLRPDLSGNRTYRISVVLLARKLQCAATGRFPAFPAILYLAQAEAIASNDNLLHSLAASLVGLSREMEG